MEGTAAGCIVETGRGERKAVAWGRLWQGTSAVVQTLGLRSKGSAESVKGRWNMGRGNAEACWKAAENSM